MFSIYKFIEANVLNYVLIFIIKSKVWKLHLIVPFILYVYFLFLIVETTMRPNIPLEKFSTVCMSSDTVAEIIRFSSNLSQMFICYPKMEALLWVYIVQIARVQGCTKISQYVTVYGRKCVFFLPVRGANTHRNYLICLKFCTNACVMGN